MEHKDQGTQKNAESTTACDNPFFSPMSRICLGQLWDQKGMHRAAIMTCVDALSRATQVTCEGDEEEIYLPIKDVSRAVKVLTTLKDCDNKKIALVAEEMLEDIDDHLRGLWRMTPDGLPIDKATETEIRALTGGYYPDNEKVQE